MQKKQIKTETIIFLLSILVGQQIKNIIKIIIFGMLNIYSYLPLEAERTLPEQQSLY